MGNNCKEICVLGCCHISGSNRNTQVMVLLALKRHMTVLILFVFFGFGSTDTNGLPSKCRCGIFLAISVISKCLVMLKD
jgi:hypothetical protein